MARYPTYYRYGSRSERLGSQLTPEQIVRKALTGQIYGPNDRLPVLNRPMKTVNPVDRGIRSPARVPASLTKPAQEASKAIIKTVIKGSVRTVVLGPSPLGLLSLGWQMWQIYDLWNQMETNGWMQAQANAGVLLFPPGNWRERSRCNSLPEQVVYGGQQDICWSGVLVDTQYDPSLDTVVSTWNIANPSGSRFESGVKVAEYEQIAPGASFSLAQMAALAMPAPMAPPWSAIPHRVNSPTLERGPAPAPRADPSLSWGGPGGPTKVFTPHMRRPPGPQVKEHKAKYNGGPAVLQFLKAMLHALTEINEVFDAYGEALPGDLAKQYKKQKGYFRKQQFVWKHFGKADLNKFIENVVINELQDKLIGAMRRNASQGWFSGQNSNRRGLPVSNTWGPAMNGGGFAGPPKNPLEWLGEQLGLNQTITDI